MKDDVGTRKLLYHCPDELKRTRSTNDKNIIINTKKNMLIFFLMKYLYRFSY